MIASSLLQDGSNSPRTGKRANIPAVTQNFFEGFGLSAYPFNDTLGVAFYEVFFGRVGTHFGEASFQFLHTIQGFLEAPFLGLAKFFNIFL
jgi:hypothetical protein